ncbi:MAG: menaquinone biosynthesis decarboxylase [Salinivirgaceae bacterium]
MSYKGLRSFVDELIFDNELIEIDQQVSTELEITEIADRFSKRPDGGKGLLFKKTGTSFPLLINAYGNDKRINLALGINDEREFSRRITQLFDRFKEKPKGLVNKLKLLPQLVSIARFMPRQTTKKGECQFHIDRSPNLNNLPILKCWPYDGGKFVTLPVVHTVDPNTGERNVGMYRMQQLSENTTGMHWHKHKVGARHYAEYKKQGKPMPVSVVLGGDPVYTYVATAPMPDHFDEYILAGFIRQKPVELVKCITNNLYVPSDADIVIEGYIDTEEDLVFEGPFGDHTGFYSLADYYPKFHVTCITSRKDAIYPATIVGVPPMEDAFLGKISEHLFLKPLQMGIAPDVTDMHMPVAGVVHNLVIASADIQYEGQAFKIANALWGAGQMMFTKYIIVVDADVNIRSYTEVLEAVLQNCDVQADTLFSKGPLDILDHASDRQAVGGKLCIDATRKNLVSAHKQPHLLSKPVEGVEMVLLQPGIAFVYTDNLEADRNRIQLDFKDETCWVFFVEKELRKLNLYTLAWYIMGNTDAVRDVRRINNLVCIDASRKHGRQGFSRAWPDLVVMNQAVIDKIDESWSQLNIGQFIESPSNALKSIAEETGAELS